jgi:AcrR family transcriptional regulator
LLDVAIELLDSEGVAAVTTRRVAALADTTAPAIYELFDDKTGLVRAVFFEGFRRLGDVLDRLPPPVGQLDDIVAAIEAFRSFARDNPSLFEVMYSRPFADFTPTAEEQSFGDNTRRAVVERIRCCVDAGKLHGDPVDIAHAVLGLAIGLATQEVGGWLGSTDETVDRRWASGVHSILAGYGPS